MAKKPKMPLKSKIRVSRKEIPEVDAKVKKPKASVPEIPKVIQPAVAPKVPWTPERQHGAVMSKILRDESRKVLREKASKAKETSVNAKPLNPAKVGMAKPVGKITPRVESRVRVVNQPRAFGDIVVRQGVPSSRAPVVVGSREVTKPVVGGLSVSKGAIERVGTPLGTANATGSAIRGSRKLFGALTGGKSRALGYIGASLALPEKAGPALGAAQHAATARELHKFGAKAALGQVAKRAVPIVGAAFAATEIANAGLEGYRAYKSQKEAEHNAAYQASKYASPLVHQQFLRSRAAAAQKAGAMPDSSKTGVPSKSAGSAPAIKPGRSEFGSAFSQARKAGQKSFEYKGKKYHTRLASEPTKVSKASAQTRESAKPSYDSQSFVKSLPQAERSANNVVRAEVGETPTPSKKSFKIGFGRFLRSHPKGSR